MTGATRHHARVLLILRFGGHHRALGQQLPRPAAQYCGGKAPPPWLRCFTSASRRGVSSAALSPISLATAAWYRSASSACCLARFYCSCRSSSRRWRALFSSGSAGAPVYPGLLHQTPVRFGAENAQAVMGMQMACAYVGSMTMPAFFGKLSDLLGMQIYPVILMAFARAARLCRVERKPSDARPQITRRLDKNQNRQSCERCAKISLGRSLFLSFSENLCYTKNNILP